ncbi:MAG: V-type ATPase 116kDa subunit family protein, partial [Phycisphaerae bacterium]
MAIVQMTKFMIVSHRGEAGRLLESLQQAGICQILNADTAAISKQMKDLEQGGEKSIDIEEILGRLVRGIDFLKPYSKSAGGLSAILAPRTVVDKRTYEQVTTDDAVLKVAEQCSQTQLAIERLKSEIDNQNRRLEELRPWKGLDVVIEDLGQLKQVRCWVGFVPGQHFEQLEQDLTQAGAVVQSIGEAGTKNTCVIVALRDIEEQTGKLLRSAEFEQAELAGVTGTVAEAMSEITGKLEKAEEELAGHRAQAESLTKYLLKLEILYDHYSNLLNREQTEKSAPATKQTVIFEGWVRRKDFPRLEKIVGRFSASSLHKITPPEDEEIPVEIENVNAIKPFEVVTRLYGMPKHFNLDPTVFFAPFFTVFFALCLADAGYGILMVLIAGWMIRKMQGGKLLMWMLMICGVSTAIFGAMTGGRFGD